MKLQSDFFISLLEFISESPYGKNMADLIRILTTENLPIGGMHSISQFNFFLLVCINRRKYLKVCKCSSLIDTYTLDFKYEK